MRQTIAGPSRSRAAGTSPRSTWSWRSDACRTRACRIFRGSRRLRGKVFHTGEWPHEGVDFTGLRVGVVGTGSSAIQSIPVIAGEAKHVTVFQRTPNYSIPARNYPLSEDEKRAWAENYREFRRRAREEMRNGIVSEIPQKGALEDSDNEREANLRFPLGARRAHLHDRLQQSRARQVRERHGGRVRAATRSARP